MIQGQHWGSLMYFKNRTRQGVTSRWACTVLLVALIPGTGAADDDSVRQAELDAACEAAREKQLAPIRREIEAECIEKKQGDVSFCKRYAAGYNGERPGQGLRFYELPECEAAFEFRKRHRKPGGD
jgi:hypothetical protein